MVAAFYPYAYVVERVAGDHADVVNLTAPGLEPHDLELTPRQVADLSEADLVVYERASSRLSTRPSTRMPTAARWTSPTSYP